MVSSLIVDEGEGAWATDLFTFQQNCYAAFFKDLAVDKVPCANKAHRGKRTVSYSTIESFVSNTIHSNLFFVIIIIFLFLEK